MKVLMVVVALAIVGLLGAWFALGIYMFSGLAEPLSGELPDWDEPRAEGDGLPRLKICGVN